MTEVIPNLKGIPRNSFELEEAEGAFVIRSLSGEEVGSVELDVATVINSMIKTQQIADFDGGKPDDFGPNGYDSELIDRPIHENKNDYEDGELTAEQSVAKKEIRDVNCHRTAFQILPQAASERFSESFELLSDGDLKEKIENTSPPMLVQCGWISNPNYPNQIDEKHSFVALTNQPEIVCFQKMGSNLPYEFINIDEITRYWNGVARKSNTDLQWRVISDT